jgi:hypothetical protein
VTLSQPEQDSKPLGWPEPVVDLLEAIVSSWQTVVLVLLMGALTTGVWIWLAPPFYVSSAVAILMPREKPNLDIAINTSLLSTSQSVARRATAGPLMLPPQPGLYMELLRSDPVTVGIAERVQAALDPEGKHSITELAVIIRGMVKVIGSEEGLLTVEVSAGDRDLAAELANAFVDAGELASQLIERKLIVEQLNYLESAMSGARLDLAVTESALREFYAMHGILDAQQESTENLRQIRETSMLRDKFMRQLGERELQFAEEEVGVQQLRRQMEIADERLAQLQKRTANTVSGENYGALLMEHNSLQERIRVKRDMLQTLGAQHMVFSVRVDQPGGSLVTIRRAAASITPTGPRKKRIILVGAAASISLALILSILLSQWSKAQASSRFRDRIRMIRQHIPMRRRVRHTSG